MELRLAGLPTNNLDTERDFAKFNRLSEVARFCNRKFSAKSIGNDTTLFKSRKGKVQNIIRKVVNVLTLSRSMSLSLKNQLCKSIDWFYVRGTLTVTGFNTREKQWNEKQIVRNLYQRKNAESRETERLCQEAP